MSITAPKSLRAFFAELRKWLNATVCPLLYMECDSACTHVD
jgi:hypothetical protein